MPIFWNDLSPLDDIIDTINVKKFNNKSIEDFKESIMYFIQDYLKSNPREYEEYNFQKNLYDNIYTIILNTYGCDIVDSINLSIDVIIKECIELYFLIYDNPRSFNNTFIINEPDIEYVENIFENIKNKEQPDQRTDEWYNFRWNMLTASSIYKALDTNAKQNELIVGKCKPIDKKKYNGVNTESAFHFGHKFEPLSTNFYEFLFNTKVGEFGCIRHDKYNFIGASPDGINILKENKRFGRLLEIKNPKSREITGIPKKEYWVQMQIQMEVWNLNECDFLETKFEEYKNEGEFNKDGDWYKSEDNCFKGVFVQFLHNNKPHYEYPKFQITPNNFEIWYEQIRDKNSEMTWIKNIYWKLKTYSCILVTRNKLWFKTVLPQFKKIWEIILKERKTGYSHRLPKKKQKKSTPPINNNNKFINVIQIDTTDI